jgi:hypothetical protein
MARSSSHHRPPPSPRHTAGPVRIDQKSLLAERSTPSIGSVAQPKEGSCSGVRPRHKQAHCSEPGGLLTRKWAASDKRHANTKQTVTIFCFTRTARVSPRRSLSPQARVRSRRGPRPQVPVSHFREARRKPVFANDLAASSLTAVRLGNSRPISSSMKWSLSRVSK